MCLRGREDEKRREHYCHRRVFYVDYKEEKKVFFLRRKGNDDEKIK
jgi:hypothetical protein